MQLEAKKHLEDVRQAAELVTQFAREKTVADYREDALLRSAIERQLEIIGEAISRLVKVDAETASRLPNHRRVIAFRNILAHGYDVVDHEVVWDIVTAHLPTLLREVIGLLERGG